ncbi:peptidase M13, partial [Burkholderia multivorans]
MNPESAGASADIPPLESVRPQDDLFRHINGRWIDAFTIPDDRAGDGAMRELFDTAETKVRSIIRSVVDDPQEAGGEGQKVA